MTCVRVVLVLGLACSATAQTSLPSTDYRAAVSAYRNGDLNRAAELVASRSLESMKREAASLMSAGADWRILGAAAMLHTEIVISGRAIAEPGARLHMGVALEIVEGMRSSLAGAERERAREIAAFRERWYSLAATVFLSATDPENASQFVSRGLGEFKKSARLRMLAGVIEEMRAHLIYADLHDKSVIAAMKPTRAREHQLYAIKQYQTALEEDPSLNEARLRLGRMLALVNHAGPARDALQQAAAARDDWRITYLAQLFLGALSSYERDYAGARQAFQAALEIAPMCQTAYIGLAFAERMSGRDEAARDLFERFSSWESAPLQADPWWAYQNGGLDDEGLAWLRGRVEVME